MTITSTQPNDTRSLREVSFAGALWIWSAITAAVLGYFETRRAAKPSALHHLEKRQRMESARQDQNRLWLHHF